MATSGSLVPYLLGNPVLTANAIANDTVYTTVSQYDNTGTLITNTYTTVNVVPNTYLATSVLNNMINGSQVTMMSFGTIQPGTYQVSLRYQAIETAGIAGDSIVVRVFASTSPGITGYGTSTKSYFLTNATNSAIDNTFTVTFVLPIASPLLVQGYYSGSTACTLTLYPGVTLQKIG